MPDKSDSVESVKYMYLDFNGKLNKDLLQREFFLRVANLEKENPLVQINDTIFKGNYDYSTGTNLFFNTKEQVNSSTPFEKVAPVKATCIVNSTRVIHLEQVKIPPRKANIPREFKNIEFNLEWDYNSLLEKFSNGTLKIEDIIKSCEKNTEYEGNPAEVLKDISHNEANDATLSKKTEDIDCKFENTEFMDSSENVSSVQILETDYNKLKLLSVRPVRRKINRELVQDCKPKYKKAYDYHNIEKQILKPSDAFRTEPVFNIDEDTLCNCVDIDRCVLYGILNPSPVFPRRLTDEEKRKVLTLENFENLSLSARYCVLEEHVKNLEEYIKTAAEIELNTFDEFGRTPLETLEIFKKLKEALKRRIEEIKYSLINE